MAESRLDSQLRILVCVTGQKTCDRLIQEGAHIARQLDGRVSVVHVVAQGSNFMGSHMEGAALEYLFRAADDVEADMTVLRADDVLSTLVDFARKQQADCIVVGAGAGREGGEFAEQLRLRLPHVEVRSVFAR